MLNPSKLYSAHRFKFFTNQIPVFPINAPPSINKSHPKAHLAIRQRPLYFRFFLNSGSRGSAWSPRPKTYVNRFPFQQGNHPNSGRQEALRILFHKVIQGPVHDSSLPRGIIIFWRRMLPWTKLPMEQLSPSWHRLQFHPIPTSDELTFAARSQKRSRVLALVERIAANH